MSYPKYVGPSVRRALENIEKNFGNIFKETREGLESEDSKTPRLCLKEIERIVKFMAEDLKKVKDELDD